jgi:hypothetical protein
MIRSILFSFALSKSAFAAFPLLMNEPVSVAQGFYNFDLDTTQNGRSIVAMDTLGESIFYAIGGRNNLSASPLRISRSGIRSFPFIFPTASGSTWLMDLNVGPIFAVLNPPTTKHFLGFDQNGVLRGAIARSVPIQSVISTDSGLSSLSATRIFNVATGQFRNFSPCSDENGATISNCVVSTNGNLTAVGLGAKIWLIRFLGRNDNWRAELVAFDSDGRQLEVLALPGQLKNPFAWLSGVNGQLRVATTVQERNTTLFNVSVQPSAQVRAVGKVSPASSARALGNGDWLMSSNGRYSQVTPVAFTGEIRTLTPNFEFETAATELEPYFETSVHGDTLICLRENNPPYFCRYEWRDAHGALIMNRSDLHRAKFEPSGNLLALTVDRTATVPALQAQRLDRRGAQIGEIEGFADVAVRPERLSLHRGPNNEVLSFSGYGSRIKNVINRISTDGSAQRAGTLSPLYSAIVLHAPGSPWISQGLSDTDQIESVNILTGARYFIARGGRKIAVGEAIYEFNDNAGIPGLRIHRAGQVGAVTLPTVAATLISVKQVNPALANQDELRFVLRIGHTNQFVVMGVANGQAIERFRMPGFILSDGSLLTNNDLNTWTKYNSDGSTVHPYRVCGEPTEAGDDGKGGMWTRRKVEADEGSYFIMCYTGHDGALSEAITPSQSFENLLVVEGGDWLQLTGFRQTRYRAVDGVVRHHTRVRESLAWPDSRSVINIGDKLYFSATQSTVSELGLRTVDTFIDQTDLIPAAEVIDQYTRSGFE